MSKCFCFAPMFNDVCVCGKISKKDFTIDSGIGFYSVKYVPVVIQDGFEDPDSDGHFDSDNRVIQVCNTVDDKEQTRTLMHELNHLVLHMAGFQDPIGDICEEQLVSSITNMWLILERLNPGLMQKIGKELNV